MVLVCDREHSERAMSLRKHLRSLGCPCAVSAVSEIRDYLPVLLIVTYCDVFDDLRRTPHEDIFALVIGNGFVNTALNARRTESEDSAVEDIRSFLYRQNGMEGNRILPSGVFAENELFLSAFFFEIRGLRVCPAETEYLMFKYLLNFRKPGLYADAEKIAAFCCSDPAMKPESLRNTVTVQIASLNRKLERIWGHKPIHAKRSLGYSLEPLP